MSFDGTECDKHIRGQTRPGKLDVEVPKQVLSNEHVRVRREAVRQYVVEIEDLVANPDYATPPLRHKNRAALIAEIEAITQTQDVAHWNAAFDKARIPAGPVYTLDQTFADPQVRHLGLARDIDWPATGKAQVIGQPIHMSRAKSEIVAPTPEAGEHSDEVLVEFGYTKEEIAGFRARGVV